jgi:hypothetical protein
MSDETKGHRPAAVGLQDAVRVCTVPVTLSGMAEVS